MSTILCDICNTNPARIDPRDGDAYPCNDCSYGEHMAECASLDASETGAARETELDRADGGAA